MAVQDIRNFVAINDRIGTAGQPLEDELSDIVDDGYEIVINISTNDSDDCPPDEEGVFQIHGVAYHHIPVVWTEPVFDDFVEFAGVMDAVADRKVFVHCAANYRVSVFIALYGELRMDWSRDRSDAHIATLWEPNETWLAFISEVRKTADSET